MHTLSHSAAGCLKVYPVTASVCRYEPNHVLYINSPIFLFLSEGDHDSGVDESTQRDSPKKGSGSRIPKKTPPQSPSKTRSRPGRGPGGTGRPPVRSQSVPKPFSSFGSAPSTGDKKGTYLKERKNPTEPFAALQLRNP